ncbi:MAG TPA: PEP-CTERM sorting domain-containing protein [Vicinamibacterales bacterium]|jgi:hypothetical protein|nr:PEP-CTERM sorting domain-containing protein [Vicinamibacterales bacterium]
MAKLFGVVVLAALFASRADAAPITVSAGDFLTFNFDLSGETPAPPYLRAGVNLNRSGLDFEPPPCDVCEPLDVAVWKFWTELDGNGTLFLVHNATLASAWNFLEMQDGVFSATLQMFEGSIVVDPIACGIAADESRTSGCSPFEPPQVPEPATVGLLAIGAGTLVARRRRTRAV